MTSEMMDDVLDDPEVDALADDETDQILMEVAGMRMQGMTRSVIDLCIDLVDASTSAKERVKQEEAHRVTDALPSVPMQFEIFFLFVVINNLQLFTLITC